MTGPFSCTRPPKGWYCTLHLRHRGPCPTYPSLSTRIKLWLKGYRLPAEMLRPTPPKVARK